MAQKTIRKDIPIGIDDFKELIEGNYYYVDKTLLIEEIWRAGKVVLIPRPRRFGKTLNLSMIRYFFEKSDTDHTPLFTESKILKEHPEYGKLMGQYPVIFLTFKDIGQETWNDTFHKFNVIIKSEFKRHSVIYESIKDTQNKKLFKKIWDGSASQTDLTESLKLLSEILYEHYNQQAIILIDEYDAPLHNAYNHGHYDQAVGFVRRLLSPALKGNPYLHKGVITGILTVAKEDMFSGLNNLDVFPLTQKRAKGFFGFTQNEVDTLLNYYELDNYAASIKNWYDGYHFGDEQNMYNPWSVLKCIQNEGEIGVYWANTSNDALIKKLLPRTTSDFQINFEKLLTGQEIEITLQESLVMPELDTKTYLLWSLLLFAGYLTYSSHALINNKKIYTLRIPNQEILSLFDNLINNIFFEILPSQEIKKFMEAFIKSDIAKLTDLMQQFILSSVSFFDIPKRDQERSYHLFVLGLLVCLRDHYVVKSNHESGIGRYDVMLIPKEKKHPAIIIEFKKSDSIEDLPQAVQEALEQIRDRKYAQELKDLGFTDYRAYGIAFFGKDVLVKMETH